MRSLEDRNRSVNLWTARVVPIVLLGVKAYATYVLVSQLCVNYLLQRVEKSAAIPILCIYFITFTLMIISLTRLLYVTTFHPPYIPLGPAAIEARKAKRKITSEEDAVGMGEYMTEKGREDPDSPGLELFYTKDVFITESDGRPIWCSHCANWKPDRTHHDSTSGRCIAKMDHFCPWVGGPIGENNFKYFIQYTFWTALYCLHLLVVMAVYIGRQAISPSDNVNRQFIAILALASFFFLFTLSMTGTSIDLAIKNLTTVERLRAKTVVHIMAIRKPPGGQPYQTGHPQIENVPYREIIYPLDVTSISGQFPVRELSQRPRDYDREEGLARGGPLSNPNGEQNQGTEGNVPNRPQTESRGQPVDDQLDPSVGNISGPSDLVNGVTSLSGVQQTESGLLRHNRPQPHPPPQGSRDFQASRTFAVVHSLKPGDNPWDLGNAMLNMKTVMGNTVLEWFLPTASPCLNHDSTESQFAIGPAVKRLRAEHGLSAQQEMAEVTNDWEKTNPRVARPLSGEHSYTAFHNDDRSSDPSSESIKLQTLPVRT